MKLVIKRDKWMRGSPGTLADMEGNCCVMGFLGKACGIPLFAMLDRDVPKRIQDPYKRKWPAWTSERPDVRYAITSANDNPDTQDNLREACLVDLFEMVGVELVFE